MHRSFETFYRDHAAYATTFSNLLLEPLTAPAKELLIAQYGSDGRIDNDSGAQRIASNSHGVSSLSSREPIEPIQRSPRNPKNS